MAGGCSGVDEAVLRLSAWDVAEGGLEDNGWERWSRGPRTSVTLVTWWRGEEGSTCACMSIRRCTIMKLTGTRGRRIPSTMQSPHQHHGRAEVWRADVVG